MATASSGHLESHASAAYRLRALTAGKYILSLTNSHGEAVKGTPLDIKVQPSVVSATRSSAELLQNSIMAGAKAELELTPRDMYGNEVRWMSEQRQATRPVTTLLRKPAL